MASISITIGNDVYFKVVKESNEKGLSISKVITHHLREYYKAKEIKEARDKFQAGEITEEEFRERC